jgi:hypothetical protein
MPFGSVTAQHLQTGKTVELVLNQLVILGEHPVLVVEHLGETNKAFWNDALAKANVKATDGARRTKLTPADVIAGRIKNREAVAKFSVRGTIGFYHDHADRPGVPDPARPATNVDIRDIVMALPDEVFDSVLAFVINGENFREHAIAGDPKELAGK